MKHPIYWTNKDLRRTAIVIMVALGALVIIAAFFPTLIWSFLFGDLSNWANNTASFCYQVGSLWKYWDEPENLICK